MLNFYLNQDSIAAKYCINKYKPGLHCNGHCFLVRQLKKEQQKETKDMGDQMSKIEVVACKNYFPQIKPTFTQTIVEKPFCDYKTPSYSKDISLLVFKPPRA